MIRIEIFKPSSMQLEDIYELLEGLGIEWTEETDNLRTVAIEIAEEYESELLELYGLLSDLNVEWEQYNLDLEY